MVALCALGGLLLIVAGARRFLHICEPNEALIFSGRRRIAEDGREVGYRVIFGGRSWRWPIFEKVDRMNLSLLSVPMTIQGYSNGGIELSMNAIANVKVSSDPKVIGNAIERFLGEHPSEIALVARETLEGHLRGVVATMTPEEVNEDRLKFVDELAVEAGADLRKLGLQLDMLKIQAISDDQKYLDSIGRARLATIMREAEIAESDAERVSEKSEADADALGGVAVRKANGVVLMKQNELRKIKAELWAKVKSEDARSEQAALAERANAEQALHEIRREVERLRRTVEVTIPAEAEKTAMTLLAQGEASIIEENGIAIADALAEVNTAWQECGNDAMDMMVVQQLDEIFTHVTDAAKASHAEEVSLLDSGDGSTVASYAAAYPKTVRVLLDEISGTLGVDIGRVMRGRDASERDLPIAAE